MLKGVAASLPGDDAVELLARAEEIEHRIHAVLRRHRPNGRFITNVEYYAAVVLALSGILRRCSPQRLSSAVLSDGQPTSWSRPRTIRSCDHRPDTLAQYTMRRS